MEHTSSNTTITGTDHVQRVQHLHKKSHTCAPCLDCSPAHSAMLSSAKAMETRRIQPPPPPSASPSQGWGADLKSKTRAGIFNPPFF